MRYFEYNGDVYTVIHPSRVESLPGIPIYDPENNLTCRDMRKALWALGKAPEMAYMLKHYNHESSFLSRLNCDSARLPVVKTDLGYVLRSDIRESWHSLENALKNVCEVLLQSVWGQPEAQFPFEAHWRTPHSCGYRQAHRTSEGARRAALRSRDACALLLSRCTMAIALCSRVPEDPPRWVRILTTNGIPSAWIDVLRESVVADLSPNLRAGAFIDPYGMTEWVQHVPCMIRANLPVYIRWKPQESTSPVLQRYPFLRPYLPPLGPLPQPVEQSLHDLRFTWARVKPIAADGWQVDHASSGSAPQGSTEGPSNVVGPKKPHGPGQLPGETWQQFFDRRTRRNQSLAARATPETLAAQGARLTRASGYARPTRPTRVFLWKEAGDLDDTLPVEDLSLPVRTVVSRKSVGAIWPMYSDRQKRYDSWADEWDICPQLAPEDTYEEDDAWDEGEWDEAMPLPPSETPEGGFYESELKWFYEPEDHAAFRPELEDFSDLSRFRFGLLPVVVEGSGIPYDKFGDAGLRKCFSLVEESMTPQTRAVLRPASGLIAAWLESDGIPRAHGLIWDLESSSQSYLPHMMDQSAIQLTPHVINGEIHLRVEYQKRDEEPHSLYWSLFVDAPTALELCRRPGIDDVESASSFLARRGSRFIIAFCPEARDRDGIQITAPRPTFLGWRPAGFRADNHDYRAYEERARDILSAPRARAAILRGGIVWRLSVELMGECLIREALQGPSEDIWRHGHEIPQARAESWYEDGLSSYELDVIWAYTRSTPVRGPFSYHTNI